jgi:hypothetical protein
MPEDGLGFTETQKQYLEGFPRSVAARNTRYRRDVY